MGVTDITVAVAPTVILSAATARSAPPVLFNAGAEDITLTYGSDTDTFALAPGKTITASAYQDVSGTVAAGTEVLKILDGIEPVGGGGTAFGGLLGADLIFSHADPTIRTQNNEDLRLLPDGTGITVVGDAGSTSQGLNSNDDAYFAGEVEIDGSLFLDAAFTYFAVVAAGTIMLGATGGTTAGAIGWSIARDDLAFFAGVDFGRAFNFGDMAWRGKNFDQGIQPTPRLSIYGVDPDTDNTAFSCMQYQQSLFGGGKGAFLGIKSITELVTIPVGQGAPGPATTISVPASSRIVDAVARVTQAPGGGATTLDIGRTGGDLDELVDGISTAVDTTGDSVADHGPGVVFPLENATAKTLTLTTDANVTGTDMIVRVVVWYRDVVAPTS